MQRALTDSRCRELSQPIKEILAKAKKVMTAGNIPHSLFTLNTHHHVLVVNTSYSCLLLPEIECHLL
jgi:hypothetical protein